MLVTTLLSNDSVKNKGGGSNTYIGQKRENKNKHFKTLTSEFC